MQLRCLVLVALVAPAYALISSCPALGSHTSGWRAPAVRLEFVEEKADQPQPQLLVHYLGRTSARGGSPEIWCSAVAYMGHWIRSL